MSKIRTDYVTNSSSSSFILGFKNAEEIADIVRDELPSYWSETAINDIISDIECGITSQEDAIEFYKDHIDCWNWRFNGKTYWDMAIKERKSKEWNDFRESKMSELSRDFADELNKYNVISIVEYEDDTDFGSTLEHDIMPCFSHTIKIISHH